jgi:predicted ABC-type ATPase
MIKKPKYIIVAGINGAGKSTLYETSTFLFKNTQRVNDDEILRGFNGDWKKASDNLKAMREEIKIIHTSLDARKGLHVETTLSGNGKSQIDLIREVHENGFEVTLIYVAIDSYERAIKRVNERVKKGGHGIPPDLIKKRYYQSLKDLSVIESKVDIVYIFDNTNKFVNVYFRDSESIKINDLLSYPWIKI